MTTDPSFNFVSQAAHFFAAWAITLTVALFIPGWVILAVPIGLVLVALKEFWYDIHFQTVGASGGYEGGAQDFLYYLLGFGTATLLLGAHGS